ncbi:MAG: thrombospondin type 3 repeat-containing protein [Actinomycetota bacterium]|nr:thrombospondin type 3 repeat-containing protein [Actinomycetota bacterium]
MKKFFWPALVALTAFLTVVGAGVALADTLSIDNDVFFPGNQNSVTLSAAPGDPVSTSAQLVVDYQGTKHLQQGTTVTLVVNAAQTTLPSGYTVSSVTKTVGDPGDSSTWNDTTDQFAGMSNISFSAPNVAGPYSYTVKWSDTVETCVSGTSGDCLSGADAFTIDLTVTAPAVTDSDGDGVPDSTDNCPSVANANQTDTDGDGIGDACDSTPNGPDADGDGVPDSTDNCPNAANANQTDTDGDGIGDACDSTPNGPDADGDGVPDSTDNCPNVANANQTDTDGDGLGNACDPNSYGPVAGTVNSSGASGNEGDTLTASGNFTDQDATFQGTISKQSGDGTVLQGAGGTWTWSLATTDNGGGSVTVKVDDGEHSPAATESFSWSAANVSPTANLGNAGPVNEGTAVTVSFSGQQDPSSDDTTAGFHYAFDCAGGSLASATYAGSGTSDSKECTFADGPATKTVTGVIIDKDGGKTQYSTNVTVNNVKPTVGTLNLSGGTGTACIGGNQASLSFSFSDPGVNDNPWAISINWGDGSPNTPASAATQGAQGPYTHTYGAGTFTVSVSVTDKDTGVGSNSSASGAVSHLYAATGVLQPVNDTQAHQDPSIFKYGSTIPVKIRVTDCSSTVVSGLSPQIAVRRISGVTPPTGDEEIASTSGADTGTTMRFDATAGQYIYNLATKSLADSSATYEIRITGPFATVIANFGTKPK